MKFQEILREALTDPDMKAVRISRGEVGGSWFNTEDATIDGDSLIIRGSGEYSVVRLDAIESFAVRAS